MNQKETKDQGIRGFQEYQKWREIAEFIEKAEIPEIIRLIYHAHRGELGGRAIRQAYKSEKYPIIRFSNSRRSAVALDLLLKDKYLPFMTMERLRD